MSPWIDHFTLLSLSFLGYKMGVYYLSHMVVEPGLDPWVRKIPWRRERLPTLVFLPGEFHGQRRLMGYNPWGRKESDMT